MKQHRVCKINSPQQKNKPPPPHTHTISSESLQLQWVFIKKCLNCNKRETSPWELVSWRSHISISSSLTKQQLWPVIGLSINPGALIGILRKVWTYHILPLLLIVHWNQSLGLASGSGGPAPASTGLVWCKAGCSFLWTFSSPILVSSHLHDVHGLKVHVAMVASPSLQRWWQHWSCFFQDTNLTLKC